MGFCLNQPNCEYLLEFISSSIAHRVDRAVLTAHAQGMTFAGFLKLFMKVSKMQMFAYSYSLLLGSLHEVTIYNKVHVIKPSSPIVCYAIQ